MKLSGTCDVPDCTGEYFLKYLIVLNKRSSRTTTAHKVCRKHFLEFADVDLLQALNEARDYAKESLGVS